jgi:flagellar biosynthetic protein FlhB
MSGEKTEKPTAQKKKKGRKEGQVARTPDLGAWAGMLAASMILPLTVGIASDRAQALLRRVPDVIKNPDPELAKAALGDGLLAVAFAVAPLALGMLAIGIAAAAGQGGLHFATKLMMPKFSRLNPLQGIKRIMGPHALWEAAKALVKTAVLGAVVYSSIKGLIPVLMMSGSMPLSVLLGMVGHAVVSLMRAASVAGLVMAGADYFVARRRTNKQLKMTKQEVKEEHKRSEGDPHVKGQIRSRQMAMSRNRMMSDLSNADVVVVNPTHVAVALRYDPAKGAPRVVAKGAGAIAAKIREKANENRIPMVQDVPLARALHKSCDIGAEVPAEFFGAVARVLAFVMGLKAKGSAAGMHTPFPDRLAA